MPEMPEVAALARYLTEAMAGQSIADVQFRSIGALKTYAPGPESLRGRVVAELHRYGKWIDVPLLEPGAGVAGADSADDGALHLVFHLARAGWVRWYDTMPAGAGRSRTLAVRVRLDGSGGFDLTEAGTRKRLAVHIVRQVSEVSAIASLGPDPLEESFTASTLARILTDRRSQIKGVLRDQSVIAGIGNAYSDEILHAAQLSPFLLSANLTTGQIENLYQQMRSVLHTAIAANSGLPAADLKDAKRAEMRVHGRAGQACPVCGDTVAQVSFADSALQYCPTCQTGGKLLADRRMSRLLR